MRNDGHLTAPDGFVGGRRFESRGWVKDERHTRWRRRRVSHGAYETHISFGRFPDLGLWYVSWTAIPPATWVFEQPSDAELAVVELQNLDEDNWEVSPPPTGMIGVFGS